MKLKIKHLVFIATFILAFSVSVFYIVKAKNERYLLTIPLNHLEYDNFYYVNVEIEGQKTPLLLDTGADSLINLQKETLDKIKNKEQIGFSTWIDINGKNYKSPCYQVDLIFLEQMKLFNFIVEEKSIDSLIHAGNIVHPDEVSSEDIISKSNQETIEKKAGLFGLQCLKLDDAWFFDFPNSKMYCIKMKKFNYVLKKLQISLDDFIEVPLIKEKDHFIINIDTSFGQKAFMIDSGSERTVMRLPAKDFIEHRTLIPDTFSIGGVNFRKQEIYLYNFTDKLKCDGVLGLDFLKKRSILLDLKNNRVFISKKEAT